MSDEELNVKFDLAVEVERLRKENAELVLLHEQLRREYDEVVAANCSLALQAMGKNGFVQYSATAGDEAR